MSATYKTATDYPVHFSLRHPASNIHYPDEHFHVRGLVEMLFSPGSDEIYKESLAMHAKHQGKLEIRSKVPIRKSMISLLLTPRGWQKYAGKLQKTKTLRIVIR
jgi:hypothetical protein